MMKLFVIAALAIVGGGVGVGTITETGIGGVLNSQTTVEGTVTDVFGNHFVLETETGKLLVTAGPVRHHRIELRAGERVSVTGEDGEDDFDAFSIRREDGTVVEVRSAEGPPPWAGKRRKTDGPPAWFQQWLKESGFGRAQDGVPSSGGQQ